MVSTTGKATTKATTRRRPGRPRLPEAERRVEVLTLKLSRQERALVLAAAKAAGYALCSWSRTKLVHAAEIELRAAPAISAVSAPTK